MDRETLNRVIQNARLTRAKAAVEWARRGIIVDNAKACQEMRETYDAFAPLRAEANARGL